MPAFKALMEGLSWAVITRDDRSSSQCAYRCSSEPATPFTPLRKGESSRAPIGGCLVSHEHGFNKSFRPCSFHCPKTGYPLCGNDRIGLFKYTSRRAEGETGGRRGGVGGRRQCGHGGWREAGRLFHRHRGFGSDIGWLRDGPQGFQRSGANEE